MSEGRPTFRIAGIEKMTCMCGFLGRKCPHCGHVTPVAHAHGTDDPHPAHASRIDCVMCGNPTFETNWVTSETA